MFFQNSFLLLFHSVALLRSSSRSLCFSVLPLSTPHCSPPPSPVTFPVTFVHSASSSPIAAWLSITLNSFLIPGQLTAGSVVGAGRVLTSEGLQQRQRGDVILRTRVGGGRGSPSAGPSVTFNHPAQPPGVLLWGEAAPGQLAGTETQSSQAAVCLPVRCRARFRNDV